MAHAKDVLADQLLANANDPSWYRPLSEAVENLTEDQAFWKPDEESLCIAEIVQHLLFWNELWQKRFRDFRFDPEAAVTENIETFSIPENQTFADLSDRLLDVLLQWQPLLTEEKVDSVVDGFPFDAKWWQVISNAAAHNAYHIGQIIYIRKLQKSWQPEKEV